MFESFLLGNGPYDEMAKSFLKAKTLSDLGNYFMPRSEDEELSMRLKKLQVHGMEQQFGIPDSQEFEKELNNPTFDAASFLASRGGFKFIENMDDWRPTMPSGKLSFDVDQGLAQRMMKTMAPGGSNHVGPNYSQWLKPAVERESPAIF